MESRKIPLILLQVAVLVNLCRSQVAYPEQGSCSTPDGNPGACVNIRGCPPLLELLRGQRERPGIADFLRRSVCGYDGLDPIVCCPGQGGGGNNDKNNNNDDNRQETPGDQPQQPGLRAGELPRPGDCGFSNISHTRVVGGVPAKLGAWPWMVALGYRPSPRSTSKQPRFLCGASLITSRHVLTAAHCVYNRDDLYFARVGEHDLYSDRDGAQPQDIPIKEKRLHGGYRPPQFVNDIAILVLERDVTPTAQIRPICLPLSPEIQAKNLVGRNPFIAGWGAKNFSGPSSDVLLEVQIPVVTQEKCKAAFERFRNAVIDDRVLCAGYDKGGKDACQGDSGGPFMMPDLTTYYQIGVVSYGFRCAEPGVPGVYTRITSFLDWIKENIK